MKASISFCLAGLNRGGTAIERQLRERRVPVEQVVVVDPKPARVHALGTEFRRRGAEVQGLALRCEDAIPTQVDPALLAVLAIDDPRAMAAVIAAQPKRELAVQAVARGPGSREEPAPAFAVNFALLDGRPEVRRAAHRLMRTLGDIAPLQSSAVMRADPITAIHLQKARDATSGQSAVLLADREAARSAEQLAWLFFAGERHALAVIETGGSSARQLREEALDHMDRGVTAVALVDGSNRVDFFVGSKRRQGGSYIALHSRFQRVLALLPPAPRAFPLRSAAAALGGLLVGAAVVGAVGLAVAMTTPAAVTD